MATGLIISYLIVLALLYILGRNCWWPLFKLFRLLFQGAVGGLAIYLFNLVAVNWGFEIPLNPFNLLVAGFLGAPGFLVLLTLKYWIKI